MQDTQPQAGTTPDTHTEVNERIQVALKQVGDAADSWNSRSDFIASDLQLLAEAGARLCEAARTSLELFPAADSAQQ